MGNSGACMTLEKGSCALDASGLTLGNLGFDDDVVHTSSGTALSQMEVVPSLLLGTVKSDGATVSSRRPLLREEKELAHDLPCTDPDELLDASLVVNLPKVDAGQRLGIRTLPCRASHSISHIYKGSLLDTYNLANPDADVHIGDHIVEVNGIRGDHQKIKTEWTTNSKLVVKFITAQVITVDIKKEANGMLGIKTSSSANSKLHQVTSIAKEGALARWNSTRKGGSKSLPVEVGDYIAEVNGVHGDAELMRQEWINSEKPTIKVMAPRRRPSTPSAKSVDAEEMDG